VAVSEYIQHLPEIYRGPAADGGDSFLGEYLKIFEALISGREDVADGDTIRGLDPLTDEFVEYLDPGLVPLDAPDANGALNSEFLTYLASWVALTLDQNWDLEKRRDWLRRIVPLYKRRGTRDGIEEYLRVFVGNQVTVEELPGGFIIAEPDNSTVGVDTFIAGAPAYFFRVRINIGFPPEPFVIDEWRNVHNGTRAIVDLEKPAHTYYTLEARTPGFIVGERATIASDTLIWEKSKKL